MHKCKISQYKYTDAKFKCKKPQNILSMSTLVPIHEANISANWRILILIVSQSQVVHNILYVLLKIRQSRPFTSLCLIDMLPPAGRDWI